MKISYPKFAFHIIPVILALALLGLVYAIVVDYSIVRNTQDETSQLSAEVAELEQEKPMPTEENLKKLTYQSHVNDIDIVLYSQALKHIKIDFLHGEKPKNEVDFYFAMMAYVQYLRDKAKESSVGVPEQFLFGFDPYIQKDVIPEKDIIYPLYKQSKLIARLLVLLFESNDHGLDLISFKRESVASPDEKDAQVKGSKQASKAVSDSIGTLHPSKGKTGKGEASSYLFELEFSCYTSTLRTFINSIYEYNLPVLIRRLNIQEQGGSTGLLNTNKIKVSMSLEWLLMNFGVNRLKSKQVEQE